MHHLYPAYFTLLSAAGPDPHMQNQPLPVWLSSCPLSVSFSICSNCKFDSVHPKAKEGSQKSSLLHIECISVRLASLKCLHLHMSCLGALPALFMIFLINMVFCVCENPVPITGISRNS